MATRRTRYSLVSTTTKTAGLIDADARSRWCLLTIVLVVAVLVSGGVAIVLLYLLGEPPFSSSSPSSSSNQDAVAAVVYSSNNVAPATGGRAWNVNQVGSLESGDSIVLSCPNALGVKMYGTVIDVDAISDIVTTDITSVVGTTASVSPWIFTIGHNSSRYDRFCRVADRGGSGVLRDPRRADHRRVR